MQHASILLCRTGAEYVLNMFRESCVDSTDSALAPHHALSQAGRCSALLCCYTEYRSAEHVLEMCRESFVDSTGSALVPHAALQIRRDDYADKADRACELKQEVIRRMLAFADFFRDFLAEFQGLQSRFNQMVTSSWPLSHEPN